MSSGSRSQPCQAVRRREAWRAIRGRVAPLTVRTGCVAKLSEGGVAIGERGVAVLGHTVCPLGCSMAVPGAGVTGTGAGMTVMAQLTGCSLALYARPWNWFGVCSHAARRPVLLISRRGPSSFTCAGVRAATSTAFTLLAASTAAVETVAGLRVSRREAGRWVRVAWIRVRLPACRPRVGN